MLNETSLPIEWSKFTTNEEAKEYVIGSWNTRAGEKESSDA